jgi:hypothetical protein
VLPAALVASGNVLLAALIRGRARLILTHHGAPRFLATDAVGKEIAEYLPSLANRRGLDVDEPHTALAAMSVEW